MGVWLDVGQLANQLVPAFPSLEYSGSVAGVSVDVSLLQILLNANLGFEQNFGLSLPTTGTIGFQVAGTNQVIDVPLGQATILHIPDVLTGGNTLSLIPTVQLGAATLSNQTDMTLDISATENILQGSVSIGSYSVNLGPIISQTQNLASFNYPIYNSTVTLPGFGAVTDPAVTLQVDNTPTDVLVTPSNPAVPSQSDGTLTTAQQQACGGCTGGNFVFNNTTTGLPGNVGIGALSYNTETVHNVGALIMGNTGNATGNSGVTELDLFNSTLEGGGEIRMQGPAPGATLSPGFNGYNDISLYNSSISNTRVLMDTSLTPGSGIYIGNSAAASTSFITNSVISTVQDVAPTGISISSGYTQSAPTIYMDSGTQVLNNTSIYNVPLIIGRLGVPATLSLEGDQAYVVRAGISAATGGIPVEVFSGGTLEISGQANVMLQNVVNTGEISIQGGMVQVNAAFSSAYSFTIDGQDYSQPAGHWDVGNTGTLQLAGEIRGGSYTVTGGGAVVGLNGASLENLTLSASGGNIAVGVAGGSSPVSSMSNSTMQLIGGANLTINSELDLDSSSGIQADGSSVTIPPPARCGMAR